MPTTRARMVNDIKARVVTLQTRYSLCIKNHWTLKAHSQPSSQLSLKNLFCFMCSHVNAFLNVPLRSVVPFYQTAFWSHKVFASLAFISIFAQHEHDAIASAKWYQMNDAFMVGPRRLVLLCKNAEPKMMKSNLEREEKVYVVFDVKSWSE